MVKLIASDLDGTILRKGAQSVEPSTIKAIEQLVNKGMYFAPASGRQIVSLKRLFEPVSDKLVYIAENGALCEYKGEVIAKTPMDRKLALEIIEDVYEQPDCEVLISGQHTAYIKPKTEEYHYRMTKVVNYKTTLIDKFTDVDEDILKIAVCDLSGIDNSKEHFFSKWNGKASITVSGDLYLDFMESSVTKGKAMHQLQQYFGLSEDECMAFGDNYNDIDIYMNVRPDENATIRKELVIEYDEIKDGLGKLFEMFYRDEICNRSLFICDSQKITYMDIMNICAAFEAQFRESYGNKYKIQKQEDVKNKLVKFIENHKTELINENEEEAYSDIMQGLKNVTETLQARIQQSLDELENDYGKERIKARFMVDYENMPCRIKNSRNAMDHGRKNYKLSYNEYLDSELLRAIVYMLALKKAGIVDKNKLISVIDKISYNR